MLRMLLLAALAERDSLAAERDSVAAERDALAERIEHLQHLLRKLQRMQFGPRSERLPDEQLQFAFEEVEASLADTQAEAEKRSPDLRQKNTARRRAGRGRLPAHLPRIEQVLLPESTACPCCRGEMVEIGTDTAERLDVIPAQFRVLVTKRPKYACRACQGVVVQAAAPARLIEGGMPTEATVAQVLVARYADHLPLYRQAQGLARQGIEIGRAVLAGWLGAAACEVRPVVARLREILLGSVRLFADETTMPVLDPGRGKTKKGFAWAIARDDRPWGGTDPPAVVFHYAPGRGAEHARDAAGRLHRHPAMRRLCRLQGAGRAAGRRRGRDARLSAGATCAVDSSTSPRARRRRSPKRRSDASPRSTLSRTPSAASRPTSDGPPGKPEVSRWSRTCSPGSSSSWCDCRAAARPRRRSATP